MIWRPLLAGPVAKLAKQGGMRITAHQSHDVFHQAIPVFSRAADALVTFHHQPHSLVCVQPVTPANTACTAPDLDMFLPPTVSVIDECLPQGGGVDYLQLAVGWRASLRVILQSGGPMWLMTSWYTDTPLASIKFHAVPISRRVSPLRFQCEAFSLAASCESPTPSLLEGFPRMQAGHRVRVTSHIAIIQLADGTARVSHLHYQVL